MLLAKKAVVSIQQSWTQLSSTKYRIKTYNPETKIVPWHAPTYLKAVETWKHQHKLPNAEFPQCKDDFSHYTWRENVEVTLKSNHVEHLIDPTHVVTDKELDDMQMKWLYSLFKRNCLAPKAKNIVRNHLNDMDTRVLWNELTDAYDKSNVADRYATSLSTYITSTKFDSGVFKGTMTQQLAHFQQQVRNHNRIAKNAFTDSQLVTFLKTAVGTTDPSPTQRVGQL